MSRDMISSCIVCSCLVAVIRGSDSRLQSAEEFAKVDHTGDHSIHGDESQALATLLATVGPTSAFISHGRSVISRPRSPIGTVDDWQAVPQSARVTSPRSSHAVMDLTTFLLVYGGYIVTYPITARVIWDPLTKAFPEVFEDMVDTEIYQENQRMKEEMEARLPKRVRQYLNNLDNPPPFRLAKFMNREWYDLNGVEMPEELRNVTGNPRELVDEMFAEVDLMRGIDLDPAEGQLGYYDDNWGRLGSSLPRRGIGSDRSSPWTRRTAIRDAQELEASLRAFAEEKDLSQEEIGTVEVQRELIRQEATVLERAEDAAIVQLNAQLVTEQEKGEVVYGKVIEQGEVAFGEVMATAFAAEATQRKKVISYSDVDESEKDTTEQSEVDTAMLEKLKEQKLKEEEKETAKKGSEALK